MLARVEVIRDTLGRKGGLFIIRLNTTSPERIAIRSTAQTATDDLATMTTGDDSFDQEYVMEGDEVHIMALLDDEIRRDFVELVELGRIVNGLREVTIKCALSDVAGLSLSTHRAIDVEKARTQLRHLGERIEAACHADVEDRLLYVANRTGVADVRHNCLTLLMDTYRGRSSATRAASLAVKETGSRVRFEGAKLLGARGIETLQAIVASRTEPLEQRAEALEELASRLAHQEVRRLIAGYLDAEGALRDTAIRLAAALGDPLLLEHLQQIVRSGSEEAAQVAKRELSKNALAFAQSK